MYQEERGRDPGRGSEVCCFHPGNPRRPRSDAGRWPASSWSGGLGWGAAACPREGVPAAHRAQGPARTRLPASGPPQPGARLTLPLSPKLSRGGPHSSPHPAPLRGARARPPRTPALARASPQRGQRPAAPARRPVLAPIRRPASGVPEGQVGPHGRHPTPRRRVALGPAPTRLLRQGPRSGSLSAPGSPGGRGRGGAAKRVRGGPRGAGPRGGQWGLGGGSWDGFSNGSAGRAGRGADRARKLGARGRAGGSGGGPEAGGGAGALGAAARAQAGYRVARARVAEAPPLQSPHLRGKGPRGSVPGRGAQASLLLLPPAPAGRGAPPIPGARPRPFAEAQCVRAPRAPELPAIRAALGPPWLRPGAGLGTRGRGLERPEMKRTGL